MKIFQMSWTICDKIAQQIQQERRFDNQMSIMRIASIKRVLNVPPDWEVIM